MSDNPKHWYCTECGNSIPFRCSCGSDMEMTETVIANRELAEFKKNDKGKMRYHLLPQSIIDGMVEVLEYGATRYGEWNWLKGGEWTRLYDATHRHLKGFWCGEELDRESGLPHLSHVLVNIAFLEVYRQRGIGVDDRPGTLAEKIMSELKEADHLREKELIYSTGQNYPAASE